MRISVLARGGLSVQGGHYDPHDDEAYVLLRDGETASLVIEYPSAPTLPSKAEAGLASTTPTISGLTLNATLSAPKDGGYVDITATFGGQIRTVRIRARTPSLPDGYAAN